MIYLVNTLRILTAIFRFLVRFGHRIHQWRREHAGTSDIFPFVYLNRMHCLFPIFSPNFQSFRDDVNNGCELDEWQLGFVTSVRISLLLSVRACMWTVLCMYVHVYKYTCMCVRKVHVGS